MDLMEVDTATDWTIDFLPAEIWHQIVAYLTVSDLPAITRSCKYFHTSITIKVKRDLIAKVKIGDYLNVRYNEIKGKFSEHLAKSAVHRNDASFMDEFLTEQIWPWNIAVLYFVPKQKYQHPTYYKSKEKEVETFRIKFFEEMLLNNATNVLEWIMLRFDDIEPEALGFSLGQNGAFQLFLLCLLKQVLATEKTIRKRAIFDQAMNIIEKYSDILIRLIILARDQFRITPDLSNVDKAKTPSYVCFDYELNELLDNDSMKYLNFLIYLHVTHDKYNLNFDTAAVDVNENTVTDELFSLPKRHLPLALMMTPLELAYSVGDHLMVNEIQKISPIDKTHPYIAWIILNGSQAENRLLNSIIKLANINAEFSPGLKTLLKNIYLKPIETVLGFATFRLTERPRQCTLEWLLANGAKFSEKEIDFIVRSDSRDLKQVLFASQTPKYSVLQNIPEKEVDLKARTTTFKQHRKKGTFRDQMEIIIRPNSTFSYFKKGGEYQGTWELKNNELVCKSTKHVERIFSGGSWGGFSDKVTNVTTEFKYNVLTTCYDEPVLIDADSKAKTATFNNLLKFHWAQ